MTALTVPSNSEPITLVLRHRTYYALVPKASRLDPSTFPDSPYAAELQRETSKLRFQAPLEEEYLRARLLSSRTLVRIACVFAIVLTCARSIEQLYERAADLSTLIGLALVIGSSIALAGIAWSPSFERLYPYWGRLLVPLRNSLIAVEVAAAATHGQPEMLMALPITLIGAFFFLGLPFRVSLFCCAATVAAYVAAATWFGLTPIVALHFVRSPARRRCGLSHCRLASREGLSTVVSRRPTHRRARPTRSADGDEESPDVR